MPMRRRQASSPASCCCGIPGSGRGHEAGSILRPAGMALQWQKTYFLPDRRFVSSADALRVAVVVANA